MSHTTVTDTLYWFEQRKYYMARLETESDPRQRRDLSAAITYYSMQLLGVPQAQAYDRYMELISVAP